MRTCMAVLRALSAGAFIECRMAPTPSAPTTPLLARSCVMTAAIAWSTSHRRDDDRGERSGRETRGAVAERFLRREPCWDRHIRELFVGAISRVVARTVA